MFYSICRSIRIFIHFSVPSAVPDKDISSDPHLLLNLLLGRGLVSRQSLGGLVDLAEQLVRLPHLLREHHTLLLDLPRVLEVAWLLEILVCRHLGLVHPGDQLLLEAVEELLLVLHVGGELLEVDGVDVGLVVDQPRLALGQNLRDLRLNSISALLTFLEYSSNKIIYLGLN